ncbi:PLAT domain-containing protein 2-like isoform X2 [Dendrobium catenatum]|uniref:PLAT domain-containing protein 2-like isoform X2 n=1 Tax=Dendrobium catenatum TaxID=906689 RepID=UPI00109F4490|nr:PLAT domain-containing protein 2-like isoform X2 [Dendrobium catenatum]
MTLKRTIEKMSPLPFSILFLLFFVAAASTTKNKNDEKQECVYSIYVRTGSIIKSGTDASISLTLADSSANQFHIPDLVSWGGLMGPQHNYFERTSLDVFSGRATCGLRGPICSLNLTSDGAGAHHGWYCDSVEVTATGPHLPCSQTLFYVQQWLASDAAPYQLYAYVNGCDGVERERRLVVGAAAAEARKWSILMAAIKAPRWLDEILTSYLKLLRLPDHR